MQSLIVEQRGDNNVAVLVRPAETTRGLVQVALARSVPLSGEPWIDRRRSPSQEQCIKALDGVAASGRQAQVPRIVRG